ncbi:MAG: threonine/serine dehydratase [Pseudomonadota bacterium]
MEFSAIEAAALRLRDHLAPTPLLQFAALDQRLGGAVWLKAESLQGIGSFKIRGAMNALLAVGDAARAHGVVAGSSGNHAQGVAQASAWLGCRARIVMPIDAPAGKRASVVRLGAEIVDYDRYSEDREAIAARLAEQAGAFLLPAYDHPEVIAGQGTAGLEVMRSALFEHHPPDQVVVCCGGGGLTAGVSLAVKALAPAVDIIAVEPANADDTARSLAAGQRLANAKDATSVCDALLSPMPGALTFPILQAHGVRVVTVSDEEALRAVGYAYRRLRLVLEPGGAVALAALLSGKVAATGKRTVAILSGGNIDDPMLERALGLFDASE